MIRILALILSLSLLFAQTESQTPPETVIRINVNLVQVDANVTGSHGKSVTGLKAGDFEILQDGMPQVITNFSYINIQPDAVAAARPRVAAAKGAAPAPAPASARSNPSPPTSANSTPPSAASSTTPSAGWA
jgi:hypothetical protein